MFSYRECYLYGEVEKGKKQVDPIDLEAAAHALEALIHAKTLMEIRSVWKQRQELLLTDYTEQILTDKIKQADLGGGSEQEQEVAHLKSHLEFIRYARTQGMDAAWKAYERSDQNRLLQIY